jgi:hypothetical protein
MVDDRPKISLSGILEQLEQLIEKGEESDSDIIPPLPLYIEEPTRNIVKERAPDALPLLDELIKKLRKGFYSWSNPNGQQFASRILLGIREYVKTYIHPEDPEHKWKVYRLIGGLKYLLKDGVLNDVYETFVAILNGKFEDPYESVREKYERYYKHLRLDLSFEEQLSRIREQQAREYIRRVIMTLMSDPGLGILTQKNKLEYLLFGYY